MEVVTLGTGSPLPSADRAGPATLVRAGGLNLLFDCGRGVLMRLAAVGLPLPAFLHHVFLTHLHSDHVTDFNDLVTTTWATSPAGTALHVTGPAGTTAFAERTLDMLRHDIGYRLAHHDDLTGPPLVETIEVTDGPAWSSGEVTVAAAPTDHRPVHPTVGYRVEHAGAAVAIAGDTVPCEGLDRLVAGADIYVQTVIRPDLIAQIPSARIQDVVDYHSSVADAARTASRGGVRTLVLTHPVPAPGPGSEAEWVAMAADHFDGDVVLAHDLLSITT